MEEATQQLLKQHNISVEFHKFKGNTDDGYWLPSKYTKPIR